MGFVPLQMVLREEPGNGGVGVLTKQPLKENAPRRGADG